MIVIEVLGWVALAFIVACIAGFVSGTYKKSKAGSYYRSATRQLEQDRELEEQLSQLRQAAATSESAEFRELAAKLTDRR